MEEKNDSSEFKFSVDDDEIPDLRFHKKKIKRTEEDKKSSSPILIPVFLFLLLVVIFVFAYLDMKSRVENIHDSGATETMKMSADLEAKITSLASRYEELEKSLNEKVFPMIETFSSVEKSVASLKDGLKKAEQNIEKISASQTDKKEIENLIAQTQKNLDPVRENLKSLESAIKSIDEKVTKEVGFLSGSFKETKESLNKLQNVVSEAAPTSGINKETLEAALENQQKIYQKRIELLVENMTGNDDKISELETKLEGFEKRLKSFAAKPLSSKSPESKYEPEKKSEPEPVIHPIDQIKPKPGTFIEQNIQ